MCISPIKIPTRSHCVRVDGYKQLYMTVPCGHCLQCRQKNSISWSIRAAYEYKYCIEENGYCLFDTLTYDDNSVPRYADFIPEAKFYGLSNEMTFNKSHVQKFLKRLRIAMMRLGYDAKEKFRYMVCSEYGSNSEYCDSYGRIRKGTNRPHYHLYFYVNNGIPPVELSKLIAKCWKYGITDGVHYKGELYVLNNRVFTGLTEHGLNANLYVQKYISKGSPYDRKVIKDCYTMLNEPLIKESLDWNERATLKKWIRCVSCWHIQSMNFGYRYYNPPVPIVTSRSSADLEQIWSRSPADLKQIWSRSPADLCALGDSFSYKIALPCYGEAKVYDMPRYYEDKLFKHDVKSYGTTLRRFKQDSVPYLKTRLMRQLNSIRRVYQDMDESDRIEVNRLLNGRSLDDYCAYKVCYDGCLGYPSGNFVADYIRSKLVDDGFNDNSHPLFVYGCPNDISRFGQAVCCYKYLGRSTPNKKIVYYDGHVLESEDYISSRNHNVCIDIFPLTQVHCVNASMKPFNGFDKIDEIFEVSNYVNSCIREIELYKRSRLRHQYKKCGMLK